jgi:ubiquinol oxidase
VAASPGVVAGPPKLPAGELRAAQAHTLRAPRFRYSIPARLLFFVTDLVYGKQGSVLKFKVLEIVARVPYQAWERAAYAALTRAHRKTGLARRIFDRVVQTRAQQDNEQWHLLIMEELAQRQGLAQPFARFRLLPQLMAIGYYHLSWILYALWPSASYRLNAAFEDHAEHEYMLFVADHPELEHEPYGACSSRSTTATRRWPTCSARSGTTSGHTRKKASPAWPNRGSGSPGPHQASVRATSCRGTGSARPFNKESHVIRTAPHRANR